MWALTVTAPAASASADEDAAPSPTVASGSPVLTLSPIGNGILGDGEVLSVSVTLDNPSADAVAASGVSLALGETPISDRGALTSWLDSETDADDGGLVTVASATMSSVEAGSSETTGMTVAADAPELTTLDPGVYPLRAVWGSGDSALRSTSALIVPDTDEAVAVTVVVPITAAPRTSALLTADELAELTAEGGALDAQLLGVQGTNTVLAVDPAIPAAIRVLGVEAPASAIAWLESLEALPNPRFALQFGDADPAVQVEAGAPQPLAPTSFASLISEDSFVPAPAPSASATDAAATPAPESESTGVPTLDELLDVGATHEVWWPSSSSVTPSAVATLANISAHTDSEGMTLVPSTATVQGRDGATVAGLAATSDADLLVADAAISRLLSDAATPGEYATRGAPLTAATAHLALAATDDASLVVAFDRSTNRSNIALSAAVGAISQLPGATVQSLTALASTRPSPVDLADAEAPADRVAEASALFDDEAAVAGFATVLDDPALLTGEERAEVLQLLGVGWDAMPAEARAAVTAHREATEGTLASVRLLPTTSPINLLASGAGLPFTVRNDLPYEVNLVLYASPDDVRLNVRPATDIVATPLSNTRVEVPVEARLGNGEVAIDLQLRSPALIDIGPPQTVDVNVRAEWETVGLIVLAVLVGGLVVLGIIRTVLRSRARRHPDPANPTDTQDAPDPAKPTDEETP
ncbi:hypothetical protein GCM10009796_19610 [Microbacterium koreense]